MLSYGLVLALFLLGPGFATYAGGLFGLQGGRFRAAPPAPNSIFAFLIVGLSALLWHALWTSALALFGEACRRTSCPSAPFDPNVYVAALSSTRSGGPALAADEIAAILTTFLLLSVVAFFATLGLVRVRAVAQLLRQPLYGLYADLVLEVSARAADGVAVYVTAYVVTDMAQDGAWLGYVGMLENLQVGADQAIANVSLVECDTFLLKIGERVSRTPSLRTEPIDRIVIAGAHIRNVAFTVVERPRPTADFGLS